MKKRLILFVAVIVFAAPTISISGFMEGNTLVEMMKVEEDAQDIRSGVYCGYVNGVADTTVFVYWCPPKDVRMGQILKIVSKYLKNHPELWHNPAEELVIDALRRAFPCKNKK